MAGPGQDPHKEEKDTCNSNHFSKDPGVARGHPHRVPRA